MTDLARPWFEFEFVAFDTETTGAYPIGNEICELAAVKWRRGQVIDRFQTLLKPSLPMTEFNMSIHGITNEMVATAPRISEKLDEFHRFVGGAVTMAHHAAFDMGFLAYEFEKAKLTWPTGPVVCTSLLAQAMIPKSETINHKLQTLIPLLGITQGQAHRALDDAEACLHVGLKCMERIGQGASLENVMAKLPPAMRWDRFAIEPLRSHKTYGPLVLAIEDRRDLKIVYKGGSQKGERTVHPIGLVRSLDGDFFVTPPDEMGGKDKRFYLSRL